MSFAASSIIFLAVVALLAYPLIRKLHSAAFAWLALAPAAVFVWLLTLAPRVLSGDTILSTISWLPELTFNLSFRLDPLSLLFAALVTGAGALILFYCWSYFGDSEDGLARFGSVFLGFACSMLGLVLADNVFLLFVFWEGTTVFSFLLIGHVTGRRASRSSALQALIVTTFGGLAMLVGLVILAATTGTPLLSEIIELEPRGALVTVAVHLVLLGALTKSAIFPFHFWLPAAMAAPTPVSAYLHAAAMVKAGIYLVLRFGPGFGDVPGFREVLVVLGAITMLNGGYRALKQFDIKLIVAHGTVSQLGFLMMLIGIAEPRAEFAGLALLLAHAMAKAPLFLAVGIIDHRTGTRDLRRLSGLGRQTPALAILTAIAAISMAGLPPLFGFVAKESVFTEMLALSAKQPILILAFVAAALGSVLTVAYMVRFMWGSFASKPGVPDAEIVHRNSPSMLIAPGIFVLFVAVGGFAAALIDPVLQAATANIDRDIPEHLALWHGVTPALGISLLVLALGISLGLLLSRPGIPYRSIPERFSAGHAYWVVTHWLDTLAVKLTAITQRGSLPFYLSVILSVTIAALGGTLVATGEWPQHVEWASSPAQIPIAAVMVIAVLFTLRARTRFQAVILVGVTGYGIAAIFALNGAPDLALTQVLVETVTLIAFVLVIRRLPKRIGIRGTRPMRWVRMTLGLLVGALLGVLALVAQGARVAKPISEYFAELAVSGGHGVNIVNVTLVDIRGWDTMGELSVVLAAATGVASLIFLRTRVDKLPKLSRRAARAQTRDQIRRVEDPNDPAQRRAWLLAGRYLDSSHRSILLEVIVRLLFHALIMLSFYLLLAGHNGPGGGFVGGLVAGLALVARYLTGGRRELGATVPIDAGRILGTGLALAATMAILPLFFGQAALSSAWIDVHLGPLGTIPFVTSTLFDIGVYLVVFGLILDVLRSLGAEIDVQEERDAEGVESNAGEERR